MSAVMMDKLLDVVVATELDQPDEEFVAAGAGVLIARALAAATLGACLGFKLRRRIEARDAE